MSNTWNPGNASATENSPANRWTSRRGRWWGELELCNRIVPFVLALSTVRSALADEGRRDIPVGTVQYFWDGSVKLNNSVPGDRLEIDNQVVSLRGSYGHDFEGTTLVTTARYDLTLSRSRLNADAPRYDSYQFPALEALLLQKLADPWGLAVYGVGGVASDMQGFGTGDLRFTIGAGAAYSVSSNLQIIAGPMVTNMLGSSTLVLPLVDVSYRTSNAKFRLGFPYGASAWLSLTSSVDLGLVVGKVNLRYDLHGAHRVADELSTLDITAGPAARIFFGRGFYVRGEGGYDVRRVELRRNDEAVFELLTFRASFMSLSAGYML